MRFFKISWLDCEQYGKNQYKKKTIQGRSQNLKQVPQNFIKTFCVDDVKLTTPANDVI